MFISSTAKDLGRFRRAVIAKVERLDGNLYLTRRHHRSYWSLEILTRRAALFMVLKKLRRFVGEKVFDPFNQESIAPRAIHLRVIARASGVELFLAGEYFDQSAVVQPVIVKLEKFSIAAAAITTTPPRMAESTPAR